jgi:hypothetical protein
MPSSAAGSQGGRSEGTVGMPFWPFSRTLPITYSGPEVERTARSRISVTTSVMTLRYTSPIRP